MPVAVHHVAEGPEDAPVVLLGSSLGATTALWEDLAADLSRDHRVVRFDTRGHGGSPVPAGPYSMEDLQGDVVALADELGVESFAYVGISLGGAVGQVLALTAPERLTSLVLCCTAPVFGDASTWRERAETVRRDGLADLVEPTTQRWFTHEFRHTHPDEVERVMATFLATPPEGYAGCCEALAGYDVTSRLGEIRTATRVIAGSADPGTPPEVGRALADAVPGADLVVIEDAAHIANVARPAEFNAAVREHLTATAS